MTRLSPVSYDYNVFPDVDVGVDDCSIDHGTLANKDVITDLQREESHPDYPRREHEVILGSRGTASNSYPLLNFLKGGLITALLLIMQCRPTRTLAKSPLMMASA